MWLFLVPMTGAWIVRLCPRCWQTWMVCAVANLITFAVMWKGIGFVGEHAAIMVAGCSALGFITPELLKAFWRFIQRPRTPLTIAVGLAATVVLVFELYVLFDLIYWLAIAALVIFGLGIMILPFLCRRGRK